MYTGDFGQPAQVSTWLLSGKRKRSPRRVVVTLVVALLEIGLLVGLYFMAGAFFPR